MKLPASINLTERQATFVAGLIEGLSPEAAAAAARYSAPKLDAWRALQVSAVQNAIQVALARQLTCELAPLALSFCRKVLKDEEGKQFGETTRREVARMVLDRAGFTPPRQATNQAQEDKAPEQMSTEELQATCARLEAELAGRARDITPDSAPMPEGMADLL